MRRIYVILAAFAFMIVIISGTTVLANTAKTAEIAPTVLEQTNLITSTAPDIDVGLSFTSFNNVATYNADDTIAMHPAAQDGLNIVLNQPTNTPEVTTGKIPTTTDTYNTVMNALTAADLTAFKIASDLVEFNLTAMSDDIGYRLDGVDFEDLVETGLANNSFVRTTDHVDGVVDARKIDENISGTTVTGEIVQTNNSWAQHAANNLDNNTANARKEISDGNVITPVNTTSASGIAQIAPTMQGNANTPGAGMTLILA